MMVVEPMKNAGRVGTSGTWVHFLWNLRTKVRQRGSSGGRHSQTTLSRPRFTAAPVPTSGIIPSSFPDCRF